MYALGVLLFGNCRPSNIHECQYSRPREYVARFQGSEQSRRDLDQRREEEGEEARLEVTYETSPFQRDRQFHSSQSLDLQR